MKPNVLLIVSDQHRLDALSASKRYPFKTPNLDRLASQGAWFSEAYTPIPLCTPARQSLLTGQRPESLGHLWNYDLGPRISALEPDHYSWPRELQKAGWSSRYIGKWHVNPTHGPTEYGYDDWVRLEDYAEWRAQRYPESPISSDWFGGVDPVPTADSRTHWMAQQAIDYIREASSAGKPWHLRLDFLEPHLPCQPTSEFAERYSPTSIPKWSDFDDELRDKPYMQRQQLLNWRVEDWTWADWAPVVARYYAIVEQLDDAIGKLLDGLDRLGVAEDTIVVYTTDHGDMGGSHRMMDKHYVMYDDVVRVPLIWRWPGHVEPQQIDAFTYNTLDLPPTLTGLLGLPGPDVAHGSAIFEESDGVLTTAPAVSERTEVVSTYNGQQFGLYTQRMIRTRTWKYVWNASDLDELYDLDADPDELHNLIEASEHSSVIADLRRRLYEQLVSVDDHIVKNDWMRDQLLNGRKLARRDFDRLE